VKVTALVVTWDSLDDIPACLASLDRQEHRDLDVLVLDNASADGTVAFVEAFISAATEGDAVLLVNPDTTLAPDLVTRLAAVLAIDPTCGSVQPKLLRPRDPAASERPDIIDTTGHVLTRPRLVLNRGSGEPDDGRFDVPGEVFGASGALVLHRRGMLEDVARAGAPGGPREYLTEDLVAYFDDVELDLRARMRGWTARYEPSAVGRHARAGASRRRRRRVQQLNVSNHLLVVLGTEGGRSLRRDAHVVAPVWLLRILVALVRSPLATVGALARLRLLPRAAARGRADRAAASVDPVAAVQGWIGPLPSGWLRASARRALR